MRLQIHSDIHLEKYPNRRLVPKSSILILAGDIGVPLYPSYQSFFRDTSRSFDKVYYILGNHEYERAWMGIDKHNFNLLDLKFKERNHMIKDILSLYSNIEILDNEYTMIDKQLVYGGTLWSDFKDCSLTKQYLAHQHQQFYAKMTKLPYLVITHYVSCRSSLIKPWSIGLGPKEDVQASKYIFGHIHYPILSENVVTNPWGGSETTESRVWIIKN